MAGFKFSKSWYFDIYIEAYQSFLTITTMVGMVCYFKNKLKNERECVYFFDKKSNVCVTLRGVVSLTYDAYIFVYNKKLIYQPMIITSYHF